MGLLDDILGSPLFSSGNVASAMPPDMMQGAPSSGYLPPQQDAPGIPGGLQYLLGGQAQPRPQSMDSPQYLSPNGQRGPEPSLESFYDAVPTGLTAPRVAREGVSPLAEDAPRVAREGMSPPAPTGLAGAVMGQGGTSANALDPYAPQQDSAPPTDVSSRGRAPISVPLGPQQSDMPQQGGGSMSAFTGAPQPQGGDMSDRLEAMLNTAQQRQNDPLRRAVSSIGAGLSKVGSSPFAGQAFANAAGASIEGGDAYDKEQMAEQTKLLDTAIRAKTAGNTDLYRQSMMALQQSRLAETTRQHDLAANKAPPGYYRNGDGTMSPIKGGPADPTQLAAVQKAKATGGALPDETADFLAERVLAGDAKALTNLGRGAQGAENIIKIQSLVAQKAAERGVSPSDMLAKVAEQSGLTAQQRTFGTQVARMAVNSTEAEGAIQQGLEVSKKVDRTRFVPINKLVQMAEANISDPDLLEFRAANLAIINTYARAISPTGTPTVHDKEEAMKVVSEATSPEAYERVMQRMLKEIDIAHNAPTKAKEEMERIRKSGTSAVGAPSKDSSTAAPAVTVPDFTDEQKQAAQADREGTLAQARAKIAANPANRAAVIEGLRKLGIEFK